MIRRKSLLVFAVLVGAIVAHEGHVALPSRGATVNLEKGTIVLSRESRDALGVETAEISTKQLPDSTSAYVTLVSPWTKHAFASSRLPGRIASLQTAPGKTVRAGQPLAEIESLELETLQEDLLKARTERRLAERLLESLRESGGAVAGQTVVEAETTLEQQKNAEVIGRIKWRSLGLDETALDAFLADPTKRVKRLVITAPLDGTVIHADVAMGRVVEPGEHLFEIVDLSTVWAKIGVLERDVDRALTGGRVEIRLTARPNEKLEAKIDAVAPSLDGPGRTATAWATIANPSSADPAWLPGMTGRARLMQSSRGEAKVVPASALVDDGVSQYVLVEEAAAQKQSEYRRKDVVVVRRTANSVEVRASSLYPGDRVVARGAQQLGGFFVPGVLKLSPEAVATIGLKTATVERRTVESVFEVDGLVDLPPESKSAASTRLGGNILRLHVDRGQRVKRGDLLAELQSVEFQTLQLDLLREELAVRLADRRLRSLQSLGGAVPQRQVLEIEATAVSARSRRDTLRLRLEAVGVAASQIDELLERRLLIDSIPVRAPIDGVVASFDKALGQVVRAEEPLFAVYDLSQSLVKGLVSERDVGRLSLGQPVRVRFSSRPEDWVAGKFVRTSGVFSADQAMSIWVETDVGARHSLRLGQLARISAASNEPAMPASLVVPPSALIREAARSYVFVRNADGAFERRAVSTGRSNDVHVEVVSGLVDGETVVVRGASGLQTAHASIR